MTSYIKMIDIWMIFMMLYPFLVVCLYTLLEVLKNKKNQIQTQKISGDWIDNQFLLNIRMVKFVHFWLNYGLPIFDISFIIIYWTMGMVNHGFTHVHSVC